jgi:hypothetical protein
LDGVLSQAVKELIEGECLPLSPAPVKEEGEEGASIGCDLIASSRSSLESKKSLEDRENAGIDPKLTIPVIQKGCIPNEDEADSEPQTETVSFPLAPLVPQYLCPGCLACLPAQSRKSLCVSKRLAAYPFLLPSFFRSINE